MSATFDDLIYVVPLERSQDPLLEEILSAEGYKVATVPNLHGVTEGSSCAGMVFLLGEASPARLDELLLESDRRFPKAKMIISSGNSQAGPPSIGALAQIPAERLLWLDGDVGFSRNTDQIRKFLRGEGYSWASDLGTIPDDDAALLDSTNYDENRQQKLRSIVRFGTELSRHAELRPMLRDALHRYMEIVECDAGSIYLWDENSETLVLEAAFGPEEDKRVGLRQKLGEGLAGWVAEVGESMLVNDTRKIPKLQRVSSRYSNFSCIAAPITYNGQLFGVTCLTMPRSERPFDPQDLRIAQALSQKLAAVIRPLSVLSELRRFSERLLGAFRSGSDMELKKDAQVESLRLLSSNMIESIPLGVIAYDRELRIRSANRVARSLLGLVDETAGESTGEAPLQNGLELDLTLWRSRLESVVESARKFRLQRVGYRAGGRSLTLDIHCSPLMDTEGKTIGGLLTVQDVTEDVEMEMKLSSAERLALVGRLAAKVAHELNNPLDGILRFLGLAMKTLDRPEQAREYLEESRTGLLRMGNILTELLTFSRSHRAQSAPTSLSQVIRHAIAPYEQRANSLGVEIQIDIPADLPDSPSPEIWEVFGNLAKNALDAMAEGGGVFNINATREEDHLRVLVSDTGPGVPLEIRDRIFEPFFTTKRSSGTGLGLALCRDALRRIGGEISYVPSEKGAAFLLTIPLKSDLESSHDSSQ